MLPLAWKALIEDRGITVNVWKEVNCRWIAFFGDINALGAANGITF
jgi:hypothetical protein